MALLDHTEVQAHMVLLDHLVPLGLPWVHTTQDHTTRDLQDHSKYSGNLFNLNFKSLCYNMNASIQKLWNADGYLFLFFLPVVHLRLTSLRDGAMATHTGNRDSLIQVSTCY